VPNPSAGMHLLVALAAGLPSLLTAEDQPALATPAASAPASVPATAPGGGAGPSAPAEDADDEFRLLPLVPDWSLHAQTTFIRQSHGAFSSPYQGTNSLTPGSENEHTWTATAFIARRLWQGAVAVVDGEMAQGIGLDGTLGIAGFPNGEATRASSSRPHYYFARYLLRQTINLGGAPVAVEDDSNQVADTVDADRLVITVGRLAATDIFDANSYSHDPRTQFLNWGAMDTGAWDYPADARGYTHGLVVELIGPAAALRLGTFMEPRFANSLELDDHVARAHGDVAELELDYQLATAAGKTRLLAFDNHAHMGSYSAALAQGQATPDITATEVYRAKYGVGLNCEQALTAWAGLFLRLGWNDGHSETWAFTEIDRSGALGVALQGLPWERTDDVLGLAVMVNGLSRDHRDYLAAGGYGFIIGDGRLNYAPESIIEGYYSIGFSRLLSVSLDYQVVNNPGYNHDRGPVNIIAVRGHLEL
jgi:high affinity Mn2+ porin